ncbi:uncharacterized protein LOC115264526 [Aedes albopictus]|uniref:Reverse transcriptase domain-containing protein n=1 Tax=Aedes albopictus TaxID=7160 RepID=A0ABM1YM18_AEDAL
MLRTPVSQQQQAKSNQQNVPAPTPNDTENNFVPGSRVSIDAALSGRRSNKSRSSRISETDSQLKALLLEEQIEEDELKASIERDKILAEKRLAALQIEQDLVLKTEERKAEFLRRKRERELKKEELKAGSSYGSSICSSRGSNSSAYTSVSQRVTQWVTETTNVEPTNPNDLRHVNLEPSNHVVRQPRREPVENDLRVPEPGVNAILLEAFKALQGRNVKDLPPFSGDIMEWTIFENEFNASTEEFQLTDRDNLRRLNKALQGKARKTVESLLSSPDNVTQIMRMLKSNFGRTEWVVANRLEALRNLDVVKEGNIESFRAFYNAVVGTMVAMQNAKASNYLLNPELISHLAEKLLVFSKQMWVRHKAALMKQDIVVDFAIFARWLEDEMDNQLASLNPAFGTKKLINSAKPKPVVFHVDDRDEEAAKKCPLCSVGSHFSLDKCGQFRGLSVAQRRTTAKSCKVCYICLKSDHARRNCKSTKKCSVCGKNHHELVHNDEPPRESPRSNQSALPNVCNVNGRNVNTLLRVGKVKILGPNGAEEVFALFDEGSSLSMIDANVAAMIGLQGPASSVTYRWTNGISHKEEQSMMLSFDISGPSAQAKWFKASHVRSVQNLDLPPVNFDIEKVKRMYPMLDEDKLVAVHGARPCMLLGSNNAGLIVPLKTVQYSLHGLQLTRCHLGWTVHGLIEPSDAGSEDCHALICTEDDDVELTNLVKQAYKVEDFGITGQSPKMSDEDQRAVDIMNRTVTRRGERFEVGQIYKYGNFSFPDSKPQALRRLQMIEKKMDSDPEFAEKYCSKIQDYVDKGYARKLEPHEVEETPNTWYLPHFSVETTGKFRLVMDAKAKSHGFSLNDLLLKGPDFVPALIAILMRARKKKFAFVADIKEMFHQILIRREDQDSQRFFFRGMDRSADPSVYIMMVMIFGAVSSPSMAQFIKNFNAKELEEEYPGVECAVVNQHYVDDYFDCADTEEEAIRLVQHVVKTHEHGGFRLVKFASNSGALLDSLDPTLVADRTGNETRVLGIRWDLHSDEFVFSLEFPKLVEEFRTGESVPTKRQLLKFMMGIFDPLGLLSPITIQLKIIFQELWRLQSDWDDEIPDGLVPRWREWLDQTAKLNEIRLPRYYFPEIPSFANAELHAFCDASDKAFACVVYIVHRHEDRSHVALVYAKARVAPLKNSTVPRLELQGCVLASQMIKTLQEEMKIEVTKVYFWTDSKICLSWLKTSQKLTAYIGSRVMKIKENGHSVDLWHWVPSQLNIADLATKSSKFGSMQEWLKGPDFLPHVSTRWPIDAPVELSPAEFVNFHAELIVDTSVD